MFDSLIQGLVFAASFLVGLGAIVFVHELGHHVVAKLLGVRVRAFSLGFGKRLWGFERGGTDYRLSAIPLGGYVRLGGELPDEATGDPDEFLSRPRGQRILVYLAGPAMNVVFSVALMTGLFMSGIWIQAVLQSPSVVGSVKEGSAGEKAGFLAGDRVLAVDGEPVSRWNELAFAVMTSPERALTLDVERGGSRFQVVLVPARDPRSGVGEAGLGPHLSPPRKLGFREAVVESVRYNAGIVRTTGVVLGKLLTGEISAKSSLSGPIEIAVVSGRAARRGFKDWLLTVSFLSISIGIMNLLPIPILDGGHVTILLLESALRRDLSVVVKERITQLGFMMLMILMAMVIFFDIAKRFS